MDIDELKYMLNDIFHSHSDYNKYCLNHDVCSLSFNIIKSYIDWSDNVIYDADSFIKEFKKILNIHVTEIFENYLKAMDYLRNVDCSLKQSMELFFNDDNIMTLWRDDEIKITSSLLASLLMIDNLYYFIDNTYNDIFNVFIKYNHLNNKSSLLDFY